MPLINCEIDYILSWYERGFMIDAPIAGQELTFITKTKSYCNNWNQVLKE